MHETMNESESFVAVVLAILNVIQALGIAWIAQRQYQVKHDLSKINGEHTRALDGIRDALSDR